MQIVIDIRDRKKRPKLADFLKLVREKKKEMVSIEEKRLEEAIDAELKEMALSGVSTPNNKIQQEVVMKLKVNHRTTTA